MSDSTVDDQSPLVSVVVTTYGRPELCKRALKSVQLQTYEPLEVVVVEDGTTTEIDEWINNNMSHAEYIRHEKNKGLAAARNTGLEYSSGSYVAYLDDDDVWKPNRIKRQIDVLYSLPDGLRKNLGVLYTDQNGNGDYEYFNLEERLTKHQFWGQGLNTVSSSYLFSKRILENVGGFDEELLSSIDHDIFMKLAIEGIDAVKIHNKLVKTDSSNDGMMTNTKKRIKGVHQFCIKWDNTFRSWLGDEEGKRYIDRYFAKVIANLANQLIYQGRFKEGVIAFRSIFIYSKETRYNLKVITTQFIYTGASKYVPKRILRIIPVKIKSQFSKW